MPKASTNNGLAHIAMGLLASVLVCAPVPAFAQSVRLIGDFQQWSAYTTSEGASKLCFAMSKPSQTDPLPDDFTAAYLYLTNRPSENIVSELNLIAGYDFATDAPAVMSIGTADYTLFTSKDAAWLQDPAAADAVAGSMRAGSSLTIEGSSARGVKVRQTFSLSGVTAASRAIDRECG